MLQKLYQHCLEENDEAYYAVNAPKENATSTSRSMQVPVELDKDLQMSVVMA